MRARAPGKVVLSGAYAVLEGAPALVSAVDRYVVADTARAPTFEAPEVRAALPSGPLPHFDASALRKNDRKLGLGSSAAIVVASLAAVVLEEEPDLPPAELANRVWQPALLAHRTAQGGGSGIDVVTSAFGATRRCWIESDGLHSEAHMLPPGLHIDVYAAREASSTPKMLATVRAWSARNFCEYRRTMDALSEAAKATSTASDLDTYLESIAEQLTQLAHMGDESGAPIVPTSLRELAREARRDRVAVHPSGAGGGDIVLCMGLFEACERWEGRLERAGLERLEVRVNALGVHRAPDGADPA